MLIFINNLYYISMYYNSYLSFFRLNINRIISLIVLKTIIFEYKSSLYLTTELISLNNAKNGIWNSKGNNECKIPLLNPTIIK